MNFRKIRAISFDITGTLLNQRHSIAETYSKAAFITKFPDPPSPEELKPIFRTVYKRFIREHPCFRYQGIPDSSRTWWMELIRSCLYSCGRTKFSEQEFQRYFRWIYQHFCSQTGFYIYSDVISFLEFLFNHSNISLGITTNTPLRSIESVLPMLGLDQYFSWYSSCDEIGYEKPHRNIFDHTYQECNFWTQPKHLRNLDSIDISSKAEYFLHNHSPIKRDEILHIGDSLSADFLGARAAGFQAILLDRTGSLSCSAFLQSLSSSSSSHSTIPTSDPYAQDWENSSIHYPEKEEDGKLLLKSCVFSDFNHMKKEMTK